MSLCLRDEEAACAAEIWPWYPASSRTALAVMDAGNNPLRVRRGCLAARQPIGDMKPGIITRPARWRLVLVVCALTLLAACGSGSGTSAGSTSSSAPSSSTTASPAASPSNSVLCTHAAALRASLDRLRHLNVSTGMVNEITADLNDVKAALTTFVNDAHGQYQAQTGVVAALGEVNTAGQNFLAAVNTSCLSASPSSTLEYSPGSRGVSARLRAVPRGAWRGYRSGRDHVCLRVSRLAASTLPGLATDQILLTPC